MKTNTTPIAFKRLPVGARFSCRLGRFRKISGTKAVELRPDGRGLTHTKHTLPRSTACIANGGNS